MSPAELFEVIGAIVTPRLAQAAARHGVAVRVWTVDEAAEMERLYDMGSMR